MNCPRCEKAMHPKKIESVEIEECGTCHGTWFERDELRKAKDQADPDLNWMDFELWKNKDRFRISAKPIKCPRCRIDMFTIQYDNTGIEIDHCSQCRGTWLENGEFQNIIDALTTEMETMTVSDYLRASLKEAADIIRNPGNLLSEWRDFLTVIRMLEYRVLTENPKLAETLTTLQRDNPIKL